MSGRVLPFRPKPDSGAHGLSVRRISEKERSDEQVVEAVRALIVSATGAARQDLDALGAQRNAHLAALCFLQRGQGIMTGARAAGGVTASSGEALDGLLGQEVLQLDPAWEDDPEWELDCPDGADLRVWIEATRDAPTIDGDVKRWVVLTKAGGDIVDVQFGPRTHREARRALAERRRHAENAWNCLGRLPEGQGSARLGKRATRRRPVESAGNEWHVSHERRLEQVEAAIRVNANQLRGGVARAQYSRELAVSCLAMHALGLIDGALACLARVDASERQLRRVATEGVRAIAPNADADLNRLGEAQASSVLGRRFLERRPRS